MIAIDKVLINKNQKRNSDIKDGDGCFKCGNLQDLTRQAPEELKDAVLSDEIKLCIRGHYCVNAKPTKEQKAEGHRHREAFNSREK